MLRRIGTLAAAAFMGTALVAVIPASPASASTEVCVGQGTATTGALYYPGFPPVTTTPNTVGYAFTLDGVGFCLPSLGTLSAAGTLTGWCGHSTGTGTVDGHHNYSHVSAGSFLVVLPTGSVPGGTAVGLVNAVPDATAGQSCITGATRFIVTGAVVLV